MDKANIKDLWARTSQAVRDMLYHCVYIEPQILFVDNRKDGIIWSMIEHHRLPGYYVIVGTDQTFKGQHEKYVDGIICKNCRELRGSYTLPECLCIDCYNVYAKEHNENLVLEGMDDLGIESESESENDEQERIPGVTYNINF